MARTSTVTLSIRHVPVDAHQTLVARAEAQGQSLQEYLLTLVQEHASHPTRAEVLARIRARKASGIASQEFAAAVREAREERTESLLSALEKPR